MSFLSKFAKIGEDRLSFNHREEPEYDSKRFRPRKALEKFEKLISRFEPAQIATRFLNSLMPVPEVMAPNVNTGLGVTPITANDITITGYAVSTASSFDSGVSATAIANVEVGFDLSGAAYQSLINGMLFRANAGALQIATQVDPLATYSVQFGFSILGLSPGSVPTFRNSTFRWEGAFQVFDSVTGQGSMAYGWTGTVDNPLNSGEVLALIAASGTRPSTAQATFNQPPATTALPQQIVAFEYVENFIGQTPSNLWPPVVNGIPFDPIPANQTFTPASFPVV